MKKIMRPLAGIALAIACMGAVQGVNSGAANAMPAAVSGVEAVTANAATGCAGAIIGHAPAVSPVSNKPVGEIVVYYNSATGYNCAKFNHLGAAWGVAANTWVSIQKCTQTKYNGQCSGVGVPVRNSGNFKYYAGPVFIHSPNNCVRVKGEMTYGGIKYSAWGILGC